MYYSSNFLFVSLYFFILLAILMHNFIVPSKSISVNFLKLLSSYYSSLPSCSNNISITFTIFIYIFFNVLKNCKYYDL